MNETVLEPQTELHDSGRHAEIMPSGKEYRLTGKMPAEAERHEEQHQDDNAGGTAAGGESNDQHTPSGDQHQPQGDDKAAAGSEPAKQQTEKPGATRVDNRYQKLSRRNRELELELARLKGLQEGREQSAGSSQQTPGEKRQASQPGTEKKEPAKRPQVDDLDDQGKPKYRNLAEYNAAVDKWHDERHVSVTREEIAKSEQARASAESEKAIAERVKKSYETARTEHPDYDDAITGLLAEKDEHGQDAFFYAKGSHLDGFFLESARGHDIMHTLAKNWDKYKGIFARNAKGQFLMHPINQIRELTKIELALPAKAGKSNGAGGGSSRANGSAGSSAKPSNAPRPPQQTSGTGAVTKEAREQAVDEKDQDTYRREANENDPRLKAYRASRAKQ